MLARLDSSRTYSRFCPSCSFPRAGDAFQRRHLIAARQDLLDRRTLALAQTRAVLLDFSARLETRDWCVLILPCTHQLDCVAFVVDHPACGERAAWRAIARLDELARLHPFLKLGFDLRNRG